MRGGRAAGSVCAHHRRAVHLNRARARDPLNRRLVSGIDAQGVAPQQVRLGGVGRLQASRALGELDRTQHGPPGPQLVFVVRRGQRCRLSRPGSAGLGERTRHRQQQRTQGQAQGHHQACRSQARLV
jgi:hypothetical protein